MHTPAGAFSPPKIATLYFLNTQYTIFGVTTQKLAFWEVISLTFLRPLRTESGVGNSLADPADPDYPADLVHEPRLGTTLPRAPGVRMTVVELTPSNYT